MAKIERVLQDGRYWYPVSTAARLLRTNAAKVRQLMGDGTLEWCQKGRSRIMMVSTESTDAYRLSEKNPNRDTIKASLRSPDPLHRGGGALPKLADRDMEAEERRRSDVFVRTWDPRAKE